MDIGWPTGPFEDPDTWRERLRHHTGNVGIVSGRGLLVVDADIYKPQGQDSLDRLVEDVGLSTETVTAITGRGGYHYFYRYDPELHVGSIPLEPLGYPGIEVKADGGQEVCAPVDPSRHRQALPLGDRLRARRDRDRIRDRGLPSFLSFFVQRFPVCWSLPSPDR